MSEPNQPQGLSNYEALLLDLEQKKAAIEAAISGIKILLGQGISSGSAIAGLPEGTAVQSGLPNDYFFGMGIAGAARKYLTSVKRPKTTREIAAALQSGGLTHTSKDFGKTVSTILSQRAQLEEDIIKVGDGWGLAAWYPGRKRNKENKD